MPRPTLATPGTIAACVAALNRGLTRAETAKAAGVSPRTLENWIAADAHQQLTEAARHNLANTLRTKRRDAGRRRR